MTQVSAYGVFSCDGCSRTAPVLSMIDGAKLCDGCAEKSAQIDQLLAATHMDDPVVCDGCGDRVAFDARIAVVARECGGTVLCDDCRPRALEAAS